MGFYCANHNALNFLAANLSIITAPQIYVRFLHDKNSGAHKILRYFFYGTDGDASEPTVRRLVRGARYIGESGLLDPMQKKEADGQIKWGVGHLNSAEGLNSEYV